MVERTRCINTPILGLWWQFWVGWSHTECEDNGVRFQVQVLVRLKKFFLFFFLISIHYFPSYLLSTVKPFDHFNATLEGWNPTVSTFFDLWVISFQIKIEVGRISICRKANEYAFFSLSGASHLYVMRISRVSSKLWIPTWYVILTTHLSSEFGFNLLPPIFLSIKLTYFPRSRLYLSADTQWANKYEILDAQGIFWIRYFLREAIPMRSGTASRPSCLCEARNREKKEPGSWST